MNISEVKKLVEGATYENQIAVLEGLCERSGDCVMNGYLGSSVTNIAYDDLGNLEFQSEHKSGNLITTSTGSLLAGSMVVKQIQDNGEKRHAQLFSWKTDGSSYTYVAFDREDVLDMTYEKLKAFHPDFLEEEVDLQLASLQIPMDNVMDIKVAQDVAPLITAQSMVDEVYSESGDQLASSFIL